MGSNESFVELPMAYVIIGFFPPFFVYYILVFLHIFPLNCNE